MPIRVHIIGSGLAGLALANALLHDPQHRYEVTVFERDDTGFSSERGGYQIRLGEDGITGLRGCLDAQSYSELAAVWGQGKLRLIAVIPVHTEVSQHPAHDIAQQSCHEHPLWLIPSPYGL